MVLYCSPEYQKVTPGRGHLLPQSCNLNKSIWYFQWKFESVGLSVQEKWLEVDFQDGNGGGRFQFSVGTNLAVFDQQVILILPIKFQVNWPFC